MSTQPLNAYLRTPENPTTDRASIDGPFRVLELNGRKGVHPTSIHSLIRFPGHNLNQTRGSLTYWVFALEEVASFWSRDVMFTELNKNPSMLPLLSDNPDLGNFIEAAFLLTFESGWHPAFMAKFYRGDIFADAIRPPQKAYAMASAFEMERDQWYQFGLSWDFDAEEVYLYVNGVRIGSSDRFHTAFKRDLIGPELFSGKPVYCFGELKLFDLVMGTDDFKRLFEEEVTGFDPQLQKRLQRVHAGQDLEEFSFTPKSPWQKRFQTGLRNPSDLDNFKLQGVVEKMETTPEGLRIRTVDEPYELRNHNKQMYLWIRGFFEGNLYVEYDFRPNHDFGLSVLVFQASGMSREDIERDYPQRTTGNMLWIHSSDMRNYHLEYFRHMNAVRNDIENAALIKNPYQWPLGYSCSQQPLTIGLWHRLQVLQKGPEITVAIDGIRQFTAFDRAFVNNGPILRCGRIALRCMINTDMHFRDMTVWTRPTRFRELTSES
jgi:hypothetical protein